MSVVAHGPLVSYRHMASYIYKHYIIDKVHEFSIRFYLGLGTAGHIAHVQYAHLLTYLKYDERFLLFQNQQH